MRNFFQSECGSVMMEFIIVFPIYLVLFAAIMAVGDMLVHSIRLPSAERTAAFDIGVSSAVGKGWDRIVDTLFHPGEEVSDAGRDQDTLAREKELHHVADEDVQGPWSVLAGVTVADRYRLLAGGAAGQLLIAGELLADETGGSRADGDFGALIHGDQAIMHSKQDGVAAYNYYTLKRCRYDETDAWTWRNHNRNPVDLMQMSESGDGRRWYADVANEGWHKGVDDANNEAHAPSSGKIESGNYRRYGKFVTWSN